MNTADLTAARRRELLELQNQMERHQAVLAGTEDRRAQHAYAASQGDKHAAGALVLIEKEEAAARSGMRNTELAIGQAKRLLGEAEVAVREEREREREAESDRLADELIAKDMEIADALKQLRSLLEQRSDIVRAIVALRALSEWDLQRIQGTEHVAGALVDVLFPYLGNHIRVNHCNGDLGRFFSRDGMILGKSVPERELSPVEREMQRDLDRRRSSRQ